MKKKDEYPQALTSISRLIAGITLVIWLVSMYCLTSVTAEYASDRYLDYLGDHASKMMRYGFEVLNTVDSPHVNQDKKKFWDTISTAEGNFGETIYTADGATGFIERLEDDRGYAAAAIFDADGNCIERSWDEFFYFEYLTEEQWAANEARSYNYARAYIDQKYLTDAGKEVANSAVQYNVPAMRFIGSFDGVEFVPIQIDYISLNDFEKTPNAWRNTTTSEVVNEHNLPWITAYEKSDAVAEGTEIITLYSDWIEGCFQEDSPSFSYNGKDYENLNALVEELGPTMATGNQVLSRYEGLDLLILSTDYRVLYDEETENTQHDTYSENGTEDEKKFYLLSAVYCSPWRAAFSELRHVYVLTFLLMVLLILWIRKTIKREIIIPMQMVGDAMVNGKDRLLGLPNKDWKWCEARALEQGYWAEMKRRGELNDEITRLNTALEYAKEAEQKRRQMTSNIAHELKTPLAIIHSYAEGLKENIAENKRDKYLDVVLSESERMDEMVLEMLDLSRLEAGKVKLSRSEFSMLELTQTVFEKLEMAIEAKNLQVTYDFPENCTV